ncbi:unnamed protein product [Clonostachys solani]|uniref:Uncharacterized protein n=1 Tax=Clonostachys solani TaxID=160281 RepID=A0A9N9Z465_9HYPO|nr:unnamed protein product [Clonostachys solani]
MAMALQVGPLGKRRLNVQSKVIDRGTGSQLFSQRKGKDVLGTNELQLSSPGWQVGSEMSQFRRSKVRWTTRTGCVACHKLAKILNILKSD